MLGCLLGSSVHAVLVHLRLDCDKRDITFLVRASKERLLSLPHTDLPQRQHSAVANQVNPRRPPERPNARSDSSQGSASVLVESSDVLPATTFHRERSYQTMRLFPFSTGQEQHDSELSNRA